MKKGFTLIELLVVIAIIALLTGIIITGLVGSKAKSRDAQRASDLSQISLAIEQYFDRCDQYPSTIYPTNGDLTTVNNGCPSAVNLSNFISKVPTDPSGTGSPLKTASYGYIVNTASTANPPTPPPTDYILYTQFEQSNSVLSQSAPASTAWTQQSASFPSGFSCTNNATTLDYCVRPN